MVIETLAYKITIIVCIIQVVSSSLRSKHILMYLYMIQVGLTRIYAVQLSFGKLLIHVVKLKVKTQREL